MNKNKKVAIYARVSTKNRGHDIENQLLQLRDYCNKKGYEIYKIYNDDETGTKGRTIRKEFDQMFKDARQNKFEILLFWSLDRFTREGLFKTIIYLQLLDSYGIVFHSYSEEYLNTENELVRSILIAVLSSLAKIEVQKISDRTKAGLEKARKNGTMLGRPSQGENFISKIISLDKLDISDTERCRRLGISRNSLKKYRGMIASEV